MATWLITAALSTALVGFVWLIVAASRGVRRGMTNAGPATSTDDTSWMFFGSGGDASHSHGHHGHHSQDGHSHEGGGFDSGSHGGFDSGGSDGGGCGGGDGGGGGGD